MPNDPTPATLVLLTPCIGVCRLDRHGYCIGCLRTGDEIARWSAMGEAERRWVMHEILPARQTP